MRAEMEEGCGTKIFGGIRDFLILMKDAG